MVYIDRLLAVFPDRNGFLFPRMTKMNRETWHSQKNILRELERIKDMTTVPDGVDVQMFRHGCAVFLIRDMGLSYDAVHAYFGHSNSEMLRKVYGTLNVSEKQQRANAAMVSLLAGEQSEYVDQDSERRKSIMMLEGQWGRWMSEIIADIK